MGFLGGIMVRNPLAKAGDIIGAGLIPGLGRFPEGGNGNWLQYSCLENPIDRGAWRATAHKVAKSWKWLKWLSMQHANESRVLVMFSTFQALFYHFLGSRNACYCLEDLITSDRWKIDSPWCSGSAFGKTFTVWTRIDWNVYWWEGFINWLIVSGIYKYERNSNCNDRVGWCSQKR